MKMTAFKNSLKTIFSSNVDPFDAERSRKTSLLGSLVLGSAIALFLGVISSIFVFQEKLYSVFAESLLFTIIIVTWIITKAGKVRAASIVLLSGFWLVFSVLILFSGGMAGAITFWYIVITIIAGVLLGIRGTIITGITCILTGLVMSAVDLGFHIPRVFMVSPFSGWFLLTIGISTSIIVIAVTLRDLNAALALGRKELEERTKAEESLKSNEARFRELAELLPQLVFECDTGGRITFANKHAHSMSGYTDEDMKNGLSIYNMVVQSDREEAKKRVRDILSGIPSGGNDYTFLRKDGTTLSVILYSVPIIRDNAPAGLRGIVIDITDRKKNETERLLMEKKIHHAQKLESLGVLAGGIAHDFNNLLMAITGNLDLALKEMPKNGAGRYSITQAIEASQKAAALADQMLTYSGRGIYKFDSVDFNRVITDNIELLKTCVSKNTNLRLELAPALPCVYADQTQLFQVVMNLVMNSSEALGIDQGDVTLTTGTVECDARYLAQSRIEEKPRPGTFVYLDVLDTGCGMEPGTLQQLFDPFFSTKFKGRGLGMSVVHGIVRSHHGSIIVWSERGKGALIRLLLPAFSDIPAADEEPSRENEDNRADSQSGAGKTVLFVDDDRSICDICARILKTIGLTVYTAFNGEDGLALFRLHKDEIDCVILDLTMPRMDGVATFNELRCIKPDVRVILSSGFNETEAYVRFKEQGLAGFIQKPYSIRKLETELSRVLGTDKNDNI